MHLQARVASRGVYYSRFPIPDSRFPIPYSRFPIPHLETHSSRLPVGRGMDNLMSDLRYAVRAFIRNPGFTIVAVTSLALGIGVNVVIFSVVNGVLEKPISGVRDSDRLVRVYRGAHSPLAYQDFRYFRDSVASFAGLVFERVERVTTERGGETTAIDAALVPDDYFSTLAVAAAAGHLFTNDGSAAPMV